MDPEVLKSVQEILFYYEEYRKGDINAYDSLCELAKCLKNAKRQRMLHIILFSVLEYVQKIKVTILNGSLKSDGRYQQLMALSEDDLDYYRAIDAYLNEYMHYCVKNDDFDHLVDAFLLTIKASTILEHIATYYEHINKLVQLDKKGISYQHPETVVEAKLALKDELEQLKKQLIKKEDS